MKILIVDDSKAMRMIVKRTLRQAGFGDHTFDEAANGRDALEAIKSDQPDLVLSDWNMPDMGGFELLEALKDEQVRVKVGIVSSQGSGDIRQQAEGAGAAFFLAKPVTPEGMRNALESVLA